MSKKKTIEQFIEESRQVHKDKYDYSLVDYKGTDLKVKIICKEHGEFAQTPYLHTHGHGCRKCHFQKISLLYRSNTNEFIKKANKIHNNKYDYSKVNYIDKKTKITIRCPIHGYFNQTPDNHLSGSGCKKCGCLSIIKKRAKTTEQFIKDAKQIHGDRYDYSLVKYVNNNTNIKIICKEHGIFYQIPITHINSKYGCEKCAKMLHDRGTKTTKNFIQDAIKVHGDKYDYSLVEYTNNHTNIKIICKDHGIFLQRPANHLQGQKCPMCKKESKGEIIVKKFLDNSNINYIPQKKFNECVGKKHKLPFDFYLPVYNLCIEYDGRQHFTGWDNNENDLIIIKKRDKIKTEFCKKEGIDLLRIPYTEFKNIEIILTKKLL